jgi:hypothetical protein
MKFLTLFRQAKHVLDPKKFLMVKLSILPSLVMNVIEQGEKTGKSDTEVLAKIKNIAKTLERQIEETGFSL